MCSKAGDDFDRQSLMNLAYRLGQEATERREKAILAAVLGENGQL